MAARIYSSFVPNIAAQWIARQKKIKGPAVCFVTACATGTVSIIEAAEMVGRGEVNICIAGASDASICPLALAGYHSIGVYAPSAMLPFSKKRTGFQVGEGAGCLILEPLEQALERGAKIYGEIGAHGYGCNTSHIVRFSSEEGTLTKVINLALEREGLKPEEISYINCHATGTEEGDIYEVEQLRKVFGPQLSHIPMSATKSMTGHMLGASGTVEILATLLGMRDGFYPPTGCLEDIDDVFKDLDLIPNQAREGQFEKALTYSLAFGGHVAALVLKKYHG